MSGKLSCTVLRRGKGSNPFSLVDYSSKEHHKMLKNNGIKGRMSRPECPYDNSCVESFFATIKKNAIIEGNMLQWMM